MGWKQREAEEIEDLPDVGFGVENVVLVADLMITPCGERPSLLEVGEHHRAVAAGNRIGEFGPRRALEGKGTHEEIDKSQVRKLDMYRVADDVNEPGLGKTVTQEIDPGRVGWVFEKDGKGGGLLSADPCQHKAQAKLKMIKVRRRDIFKQDAAAEDRGDVAGETGEMETGKRSHGREGDLILLG